MKPAQARAQDSAWAYVPVWRQLRSSPSQHSQFNINLEWIAALIKTIWKRLDIFILLNPFSPPPLQHPSSVHYLSLFATIIMSGQYSTTQTNSTVAQSKYSDQKSYNTKPSNPSHPSFSSANQPRQPQQQSSSSRSTIRTGASTTAPVFFWASHAQSTG